MIRLKIATKLFHQKPAGNQKLNRGQKILYNLCYKKTIILSGIKTICLHTSSTDFYTKPNVVWWFTKWLIPYHIYYNESHNTFSFWKTDSPLFIKLICGYTLRIVCKINLGIIYRIQTWNTLCKNIRNKIFAFIKKLAVTKNVYIYEIEINSWYIA